MPKDSYDLYMAMDVDKKTIHGAIMNEEKILHKVSFPAESNRVLACMEKKFPTAKTLFAYEAGPTGYGLYDYLTAQGKEYRSTAGAN
jgi:hypothetical protein